MVYISLWLTVCARAMTLHLLWIYDSHLCSVCVGLEHTCTVRRLAVLCFLLFLSSIGESWDYDNKYLMANWVDPGLLRSLSLPILTR